MIKDLRRYTNLGSPDYFWELLLLLDDKETKWSKKNVQDHFSNRIIDEQSIFDGCLPLLLSIDVIFLNPNDTITISTDFTKYLLNKRYFHNKLLERIVTCLTNDIIFFRIFSSKNVSYDIIYHFIQIKQSAFLFKYSNLRKLLINFDFLLPHPEKNIRKLIINKKYKRIFDKNILPEIKRRIIGIEDLKKQLEQKQIYGDEAEEFVLTFEKLKLSLHNRYGDIERISEYDTSAGYDIISFMDIHSTEIDKFIEVKSYKGSLPYFYWSRNEVEVARLKKDQYFLYLVDRRKIKLENYTPEIIQNPYQNVLNSDKWLKEVDKWFIKLQN
jgi:hypothetical protein